MAIAMTTTPTQAKALNPLTLNLTGLGNNTAYVASMYKGGGGSVHNWPFTSSGTGTASVVVVPPLPGGPTYTIDIIQVATPTTVATFPIQMGGAN